MRKFNEMYVIGIDHGYGNMKTANCCRIRSVWANLAASCARQAWMSFLSYGISSAER